MADPEIREEIKIICSRDMLFEIATFGFTSNSRDYRFCPERPFIPYEFQERVLLKLQSLIGIKDVAFPKSRQMGCSECCLLALEHPWRYMDRQKFLLTSKVKELVDGADEKALFRRLVFYWDHLPKFLMPEHKKILYSCENLENGSKFNGQATVPDIGRGAVLTAVLNDEAGEQDNAGEIASATLAATNTRIYNSTPNGRFGKGKFFYEVCKNPAIEKVWVHWSDHPDRRVGLYKLRHKITAVGKSTFTLGQMVSEGEIARERKTCSDFELSDPVKHLLPDDHDWKDDYDFHRLKFREGEKPRSPYYDHQCAREPNPKRIAKEMDLDFESSSEHFADGDDLERVNNEHCSAPMMRGEVLPDANSLTEGLPRMKPIFVKGGGNLRLWCEIIDGKPPEGSYSIGADISGGAGGKFSSQSSMVVWDNESGEQVAEWASSEYPPEEFAVKFVCLCKWFHNAFGCPEVNGPGGTNFIKKCVECGYYNMIRKPKAEFEVADRSSSQFGYHSNRGPQEIIGSLLAAIGDDKAKPRSEIIIAQLLEYEWKGGKVVHAGSMNSESGADFGKAHGDVAIAAAMGWLGVTKQQMLKCDKIVKPMATTDAPLGSIGWRAEEAKRAKTSERYVWR